MGIKKAHNVPPFVRYCSAIIPTMFDDSLSYYEALCALNRFIQKNLVDVINNNASVTQEYIELTNQLKEYIEDYFENLDVQNEINNKLDAMVEDGTLEGLIKSVYAHEELSPFVSRNIKDLVYPTSDVYQGHDHGTAQGSVVIGNSVIVALRNAKFYDDYVRLVEYDYTTGTIVREKYMELDHANAMTYDETNGLIYVASCNKVNSDHTGTVDSNVIYILDYTTLSLQGSFTPTNIPEGGRIRSVTYDNTHHKLYAADVFNVYEIDLSTQAVVNNIELETGDLNTSITNQQYTYLNGKFYGLFITYLAVWDIEGNLLKVLPFNDVKEGKYGEVESLTFKNDEGDFIMATATRYNARQGNYVCSLYQGNIYKGAENILPTETLGADTTNIFIYVDASYQGEEQGTSTKPFTDIAKALTIIKEWNKGANLYVKAGTYNYVYVNQLHALTLIAQEDGVIINGFEVKNSNVYIDNGNYITVNGMIVADSSSVISSEGMTINQSTAGTGYALNIYSNSNMLLKSGVITGNDNNNLVQVFDNSHADFTSCTFAGYTGYYAIYVNGCSSVKNYNPTMSVASSSTQRLYYTNAQSTIYLNRDAQNENNIDIAGASCKLPTSLYEMNLASTPIFKGTVCPRENNFTNAEVLLKVCGTNTRYKIVDLDITYLNASKVQVVDSKWIDDTGETFSTIVIDISSGNIRINENRRAFRAVDGTYTQEVLDTDTPATPKNWSGIAGIKFYNK